MTIKQKFERIDQSKLEPKQVDALKIVLDFTENFKTKDKDKIKITNEKLDNIIVKLQEKNPDAVKPIPSPKTSAKTPTKKVVKPKTPKRNIFSVAKEIKKEGETFEEAKKRASMLIKQEKEEANKTIKTEMQSLLKYIKLHKELQGISGTDLGRDAKRLAKVGGRRISKDGNIYYENRENRKDRLAPNYPKNAPLLENGGGLNKVMWQDVEIGDSARVKETNMMGLIIKNYGRKFHLRFPNGTEKTFDASDLEFFKLEKDEYEMAMGGSTEKYKVGQKFYDTRYDRVCEIVPSRYDGLVTWKRYNKSGTEFENDTQHSLVENQFDYLVNMGAYQISKQSMANGGTFAPNVSDGTQFMSGVYADGGDIDSKNITMAKRLKVKKWYLKTYPTDDLGEEINPDIDFWLLWKYMSQGYNFYNVLGVGDSVIRERVFEKLSEILGIDYDVIYQKWLNSDNYAKGGIIVTKIKDIPNLKDKVEKGQVTYRGLGAGKLADDFYKLAGQNGTRIKVDGQEYFITDDDFRELDWDFKNEKWMNKVKFNASARKYANGGEFMTDPTFGNFQNQVYAKGGKLTKSEVIRNMYKPSGDYFFEQKGNDLIVHLTSRDAGNSIVNLSDKYDVKDNGMGYYGVSYILSRKNKFAKGGLLKPMERYVLEIKGLTGLRVTAIESYIEDNNLSSDDVLNIVIGLGRKQLKGSNVATAVVGKKGNSESKKLIAFAKNNEGMKMANGGDLENFSDNQLMIINQNIELERHHEELEDILEDKTDVPAWVVAKIATATESISDVTHYLDGEKELLEDEKEEGEEKEESKEEDEDDVIVEPISVSSASKSNSVKDFSEDALGNLKGFLKGKEGIELEEDYTFSYKGKKFEIEPMMNSDEKGISNALFNIYNDKNEEVGEIVYTREGGKQKFRANSSFFKWNNTKFANGGTVSDAPFSVEVFKTKLRFDNELTSSSKGDFPTFAKAKEFAIDMIDNGNYYAYIVSKNGYLWGVSSNGVEQFANGGEFMTDPNFGNFQNQVYARGGGVGKTYYHILEYGDYGNIGYQGYYDTIEEAQKQVEKLSNYFPNQTFQIFADKSKKEPPITTMARGGYVSKGELVWRKLSNLDRSNFLYENFTPEITPMSQELLIRKDFNFLPKKVKIKMEAKYANVEDYAKGGKFKKYIDHDDIESVTLDINTNYVTFSGKDVLNGANIMEDGGDLSKIATYFSVKKVVKVELKNGETVNPVNGYWLKKGAKPYSKPSGTSASKIDETKAHFKIENGEVFVDSNFVNQSQNNLPNSELKHYGFGEFYLETPDGQIDFARKEDKTDGFVGRTHKLRGDNELILKLIKAMSEKGRFDSGQKLPKFQEEPKQVASASTSSGSDLTKLKKGDIVLLKDGSSTREATVTEDGLDSQKRVRVRPNGFPFDISVTLEENNKTYVIKKLMMGGSYANGGGIRSQSELKKIFSEKQNLVKNLTPKQIAEMWNKNSYGVKEGISKPMTIEYAKNPTARMYLENLLIENELTEDEQSKYFEKGGDLKGFSDNQRMIMNQNVQLEHHHEELKDILEDKTDVPAWVVAKMATANESISEVTYYLDKENDILEVENEENDEDEDEVTVEPMSVEPMTVSNVSKADMIKDFSEDALGNLKGFLKGKEGIELEEDYTFSYKGKNFEIEPVINTDEKGVSNALFTVYNDDEEQVGEVVYTRGGGKQNFIANSKFFKWNNTKFAEGGMVDSFIPNVGTIDTFMLKSMLIKNPKVKSTLGVKEFEFLKNKDTDCIGVSSKPYNVIVTDGNKEFELDMKKWTLVKPLSQARDKIKSHYSENYAKGGEIAKAEILGLKRNIMGTTDIEMKITGMRKPQSFIVYPISKDDSGDIITIQSETRIGKIDLSTGRGLMSQSHSNGAYFVHFQMDKKTSFVLSDNDLKNLKEHINKTSGASVGTRGIVTDNSGASKVFANGGNKFELGGVMVSDLAGHTSGSLGTGDSTLLSDYSGTYYGGLTGETGAMSAGEMFARGGGVGDNVLGLKKGDIYKIIDEFHTASYNTTMSVFTFIDYVDKYDEIVLKSLPFPPNPKQKNDFIYVSQVSSDGIKVLNDEEIGQVITRKYKNFVQKNYEAGGTLSDPSMLNAYSGTRYTGLVAETGALSSGELFADGGGIRMPDLERRKKVVNSLTKEDLIHYLSQNWGYRGFDRKAITADPNKRDINNLRIEVLRQMEYDDKRGVYEMGGGLPAGAEQRYVDYYLNPSPILAEGGSLKYTQKLNNSEMMNDGNYAVFSNKRNVIIADGFKTENEAKKFMYDYGLKYPNITLSIKKYNNDGSYAEGGSLEAHGIEEGDTFIKTISGNIQKVKDKNGNIVFINLSTGERDSQPPLPFKKGGSVEFSEKRKEYLQNLGNLEAEVWDKIGAFSGGQIRKDKTLLKEYALGVSKIMETDGIAHGSFDQQDYDFYTDENWHLFNEFLVWNNYYEPEMTKVEKAWRKEAFEKDPKHNYISNPEVITLNSTKRTNEQEASSSSFKPTVEFNVGDVVWQKSEKMYGVVMDNYGNKKEGSSGDIRLDSTGNTNIFEYDKNYENTGYNLVKFGSSEDAGDGNVQDIKDSANRLIKSQIEYKDKEKEKYYREIFKRVLAGEFDKKTKPTNEQEVSFSIFEKIINESKSEEDAFNKAREVKGIPLDVSKYFMEKYDPNRELTPRQSFSKFYKEVKGNTLSSKSNLNRHGFNVKIEEVSATENGKNKLLYGANIFFKDDLVRFFPAVSGDRKKIEDSIESWFKSLKSWEKNNPQSRKSGDFVVFYNQRGDEAKMTFDNKKDAYDFYDALKKVEADNIIVSEAPIAKYIPNLTKKYIPHYEIKSVTVKKGGKEVTYDAKDVLNGANMLKSGGEIDKEATYISKTNVVHVELKDGTYVKPSNGYWVKKGAIPIDKMEDGGKVEEVVINKDGIKVKSVAQPKKKLTEAEWLAKHSESKEARSYKAGGDLSKYSQFIQDEFPASKRLANKFAKKYNLPFLVLVEKDNDDEIYIKEANGFYAFPKSYIDAHDVLYVTNDKLPTSKEMAQGGKVTFKEKSKAIAKKFVGKRVEPKYQKEYGKVYSKEEAGEVGNKIAGKMVAGEKMKKGGIANRGGIMLLAKQIRNEGESWKDALKRAGDELKK